MIGAVKEDMSTYMCSTGADVIHIDIDSMSTTYLGKPWLPTAEAPEPVWQSWVMAWLCLPAAWGHDTSLIRDMVDGVVKNHVSLELVRHMTRHRDMSATCRRHLQLSRCEKWFKRGQHKKVKMYIKGGRERERESHLILHYQDKRKYQPVIYKGSVISNNRSVENNRLRR